MCTCFDEDLIARAVRSGANLRRELQTGNYTGSVRPGDKEAADPRCRKEFARPQIFTDVAPSPTCNSMEFLRDSAICQRGPMIGVDSQLDARILRVLWEWRVRAPIHGGGLVAGGLPEVGRAAVTPRERQSGRPFGGSKRCSLCFPVASWCAVAHGVDFMPRVLRLVGGNAPWWVCLVVGWWRTRKRSARPQREVDSQLR